jgi:hypothetical protein
VGDPLRSHVLPDSIFQALTHGIQIRNCPMAGRPIGRRTMPIRQFVPNASFNPEVVSLMALGFEKARRSLQLSGQKVVREAVARKIIELTQKGERDPVRMSEWTVKKLQSDAELIFSKRSDG